MLSTHSPVRSLFRTLTLSACAASFALSAADAPKPVAPIERVTPWVLEHTANGATSSFIVVLAEQADTRGAALLPTKREKGRYVYDLLTRTAERTQKPLRQLLEKRRIPFQSLWIVNAITVEAGDRALALELAGRPDVLAIESNPSVRMPVPTPDRIDERDQALASAIASVPQLPTAIEAVEWGITDTGAPTVWTAGFSGAGVVVGGEDTGYYWSHNELKSKYRGWNGTSANHDYNWHDSVHSGGNSGQCTGPNMTAPCDDGGGGTTYHGTHTMGTMVGGDGPGTSTNDIGMAWSAKWIGCRNMDRGNGTPTLYNECHQWMLAPTKIDGTGADPAMAPDVINNSWGCPVSEGCPRGSTSMLIPIQNLVNAGIVYVASAGNDGPSCGSIDLGTNAGPPAYHAKPWVFTVGAINSTHQLAGFSSLGPVTQDGSNRRKPDIAAPGVSVRSASCCTTASYATMQGTSMAGPHVAGAVALLLSARPALNGQVAQVIRALEGTTNQDVTLNGQANSCGGIAYNTYPNNHSGYGRVNIAAAVNSVCATTPATPAAAAPTAGCTGMALAWPAVSGATDYEVWRATGAGCTDTARVAATTAGLTSWSDSGLSSGAQYSYQIVAKGASCVSAAGPCVTATTATFPAVMGANDLRLQKSGVDLSISWNAVSGAGGYDAWATGDPAVNPWPDPNPGNTAPAGWTKVNGTLIPGTAWSHPGAATDTANYAYHIVPVSACGGNYSEPR